MVKLNEFCNENTEFRVEVAYLEFLIVLNNNFYQFFIVSPTFLIIRSRKLLEKYQHLQKVFSFEQKVKYDTYANFLPMKMFSNSMIAYAIYTIVLVTQRAYKV